ncbi:transmembrane signal receptor [Lithospermum erythrorhizon]|uniref:Transmembrane signal receptor n=1 Tax=Lithospermum erythrorhizon TaxID=34254 RepID=A0AAV3R5N8_LITER
MTQCKYTSELLQASGLFTSDTKYKIPGTPLPLHCKLLLQDSALLANPEYYRSMVEKLNFLTNTRSDLSYAVQTLSQFMQQPCDSHLAALQHLLCYVHSTASQGLLLQGADQLTLKVYSDSDWAACPSTSRSVAGYVVTLGDAPISWKSKKQSTVSRSSAKAEYRAMAQASAEVRWLIRLLAELNATPTLPVTLFCDNTSAMHIVKNPVFHERTKHINIDCHFTREKLLQSLLTLLHVPTIEQVADILTRFFPLYNILTSCPCLACFFLLQQLKLARGCWSHQEVRKS